MKRFIPFMIYSKFNRTLIIVRRTELARHECENGNCFDMGQDRFEWPDFKRIVINFFGLKKREIYWFRLEY